MVDGDVPAGLALCRAAKWNQTVEDWELFLKLSPEGCRVAVDEGGQVMGTVTTVRYEDRFSWIGMVLVDPTRQRQGIGIQLLRESLQVLCEDDTVKLDATPAGRHIYLQLDFMDEYFLSRMEIDRVPDNLPESAARLIQTDDLSAVLDIDEKVFGASREAVLEAILKRGPQYCFLLEDKDTIKGYCFGRSGHEFSHIGPVVAPDVASAKSLVTAALKRCDGTPVVVDAPLHSPSWIDWLTSLGFREQRPFIRMFRGSNAYPGIPKKQFAILGPEFG